MSQMKKVPEYFKTFFKEVPGAIKGYINTREFMRVVLLALAAGGGTSFMLTNLRDSLTSVLVHPHDVAWVSAIIVALVEINRRFQQGSSVEDLSK